MIIIVLNVEQKEYVMFKIYNLGQLIENILLNKWDWLAFLVALLSFIVAVWALEISKKNYKAQVETQKNTTPVFTPQSQIIVLANICANLLGNLCNLSALLVFLKQHNYKGAPIPRLLDNLKIDYKSIHLEITYKDTERFFRMSNFHQSLKFYNESLQSLQHILNSSDAKNELKNNEIATCIDITIQNFISSYSLLKDSGDDATNELRKSLFYFINSHGKYIDVNAKPSQNENIPFSVETMLSVLTNNDAGDVYNNIIKFPEIYKMIGNEMNSSRYIRDLYAPISQLTDNEEKPKDWFVDLLPFVAYRYYQDELKEFMLIDTTGVAVKHFKKSK